MSWHTPWVLGTIPVACLVVILAEHLRGFRRARLLEALGAAGEAPASVRARRIRVTLVLGALTMVGVALAGPSRSASEAAAPAGVRFPDVVLLLDVSRSMAVSDVSPDRGSVGRMAALRVATGAPGTRVGVAAFAADAYLLVPPTEDVGLVTLYAESLDPTAVTGQGSDLARALDVAVEALVTNEGTGGRGGVVVLISDGEGFQDTQRLTETLARAREERVVVHTVLVGTEDGGSVPGVLTGGHSQARPQVLKEIAEATGGMAVNGSRGGEVSGLVASLARGAPSSHDEEGPPVPASFLAACALALLLAESLVTSLHPRGAA